MTPQQKKADELVERFYKMLSSEFREDELVRKLVVSLKIDSIQCAIICVEEILKAVPTSPSSAINYLQDCYASNTYWQSVLNELKSSL